MRFLLFGGFYFGKIWKNLEKRPFFRADTAGLGKYCTDGYGRIGVYRVNNEDILFFRYFKHGKRSKKNVFGMIFRFNQCNQGKLLLWLPSNERKTKSQMNILGNVKYFVLVKTDMEYLKHIQSYEILFNLFIFWLN